MVKEGRCRVGVGGMYWELKKILFWRSGGKKGCMVWLGLGLAWLGLVWGLSIGLLHGMMLVMVVCFLLAIETWFTSLRPV
jgi:hypothetical protein